MSIRTLVVVVFANIVLVSSNIIQNSEEVESKSNQEIPVDRMKPFLIGGKHDVEQIDGTEFEVLLLLFSQLG